MPPQIKETRSSCFNETKEDLPSFLMKHNALDASIDTESTCSTDIETSLSKESLSTDSYQELESPCSLRHRGAVFEYNFDEEQRVVDPVGHVKGHAYGHNTKYNRRRLQLRTKFILVAISVVFLGVSLLRQALDRTGEYLKWRNFLENDSPRILKEIRNTPTGSTFTIRLHGSRIDLLKQSLDAHSRCSSVDEIQVDLYGSEPFPRVLYQYGAGKATQSGPFTTAGVFLLNEGMQFSCEELDNAFKTWKKDPLRFVGFFGFQPNSLSHGETNSSDLLHPTIGTYSVVSDRAAFIHSRYIDAFSPFSKGSCCESLLSMQVSLASKKPPVLMKADPREILVHPTRTTSPQTGPLDSPQVSCSTQCASYLTRFGGVHTLPNADSAVLLGLAQ